MQTSTAPQTTTRPASPDRLPVGVAVVGCGNIAGPYADVLAGYAEVRLVGAFDTDAERCAGYATRHGCRAYRTLEEALADPAVGIVVNLTPHRFHAEVTARCLDAGRHVYSEKPLALTAAEARELVDRAERAGLRLGAAPSAWLAPAQQTAWREVASGRLGTVRLAYAEVNWGRIESWHPDPRSFYEVGPLVDVGVYPVGLLTAMFGPVRRVRAFDDRLLPRRVSRSGQRFDIGAPDFSLALLELADGPLVRLTCDFYVANENSQQGVELHGDLGSLHLGSWLLPDAEVRVAEYRGPYAPVPPVREPWRGVQWARGVREMAEAMTEGRPHRASGEHAAHVVDVLEAVATAAREQRPVEVASGFRRPEPLWWSPS